MRTRTTVLNPRHLLVSAASAATMLSVCFGQGPAIEELPPAPESMILDEAGVLNDERRSALSEVLLRTAREENIGVFLFAVESLKGNEFPSERAAALAQAWLRGYDYGAVNVYVVNTNRFGVAPGGSLARIDKEGVFRNIDDNYDDLLRERKNTGETVREATLDLDYLVRSLVEEHEEKQRFLRPLIIAGILLALLLGAIAALILIREIRLQNTFDKKYKLPTSEARIRLGAPHGGGNMATITYTRKH